LERQARPSLEITPALPEDHARLGEITLAAFRALGPLPESYAAELPGALILAAHLDGRLVGGATVVLAPDSPLAERLRPGAAGLRMVAVDPSAQGHGVGRALVEATLELCRRRGLRTVGLHTTSLMQPAIRIYESLGFERRPERDLLLPSGLRLLGYEQVLR
jgi:GNAT superfamily N-acetyltransferase